MEALMAMRSVEEEMERMSSVRVVIWSTLRLFSMAWLSRDRIFSVLACTASISAWEKRSISSARLRI